MNLSDPTGHFSFHSLWRKAEATCWHAISWGLKKAGYKLTASLLNQAADGKDLTYTVRDGTYASELCRNDKGIQESIAKNIMGIAPDRTGHVRTSWTYEIPLSNGDLGAALHNVTIIFDGIPKGNILRATVTITDTFDFTELKNPLTQGSILKGLLWLANDIAYCDSKWGLLDPVNVSISFNEEYRYVIQVS